MTVAQLANKTRRFTAKMDFRELGRLQEIIEDIRDTRIARYSEEMNFKSVPWEELSAELDKKFNINRS